ncbi:MAG: S41 family peptidase [Pseudomonadota bacterium]|nr:S41 family peptidase [Pseudomonadota bacterium]MEC8664166.1 S41 family peptidase [Pseudomonadota bacterium]
MKSTYCFRKAALLTVFCATLGFVGHSPAHAQDEPRTAGEDQNAVSDSSETYRQLNLFGDVFERVRSQYVDEMTDEDLVETAINGMLISLDPHSSYLDEDDFEEMQVQTRGEFGGLGIEVTMENGFVKVVAPIDDTPAYNAGIQAGDYITHLDGEAIQGLNLSEAVDKMRGRVGTDIILTVRRVDVAEPLEYTITRDIIKIRSVRHKVIDGNIGYIRITTFNQHADSGMREAYNKIKEITGENLKGVILDLRNNPGGLLDQAIAVSDSFLDRGEIVSTRGRNEQDTKRDNATPGDITNGLPVVILINSGSASASEIVAGALQDHRRAIVFGTKSFGKGSVQTVIPLPGHGAMRLTTARYYTPSGRSIQAKGIEPDIIVEPAKIEQFKVNRVYEGDLRGALANPDDAEAAKKANPEGEEAEEEKSALDSNKEEISTEEIEDYQLSRAVDLVRGVALYESRLREEPMQMVEPEEEGEATTETEGAQ